MNRIGSTLAILFLVVSCDGYRNSSYMEQLLIKNNDRIPNAFRNLQEQPGGDNPFIDIIVSYLLRSADIPTAYSNKVSEQCKNDSLLYVEQATIQSLIPGANNWAPRMLESSGKIPLALHAPNGKINIHSYGLFDECLSVRAENENTGKDFRGRYCSVYYVPVLANLTNKNPEEAEKAAMTKLEDRLGSNWINILEIWKLAKAADAVPQVGDVTLIDLYSFSNGFCLPSSCSAADVRLAIADMVGDFALSGDNKTFISLLTATDDNHCFSQADPTRQFDGPEIAVIVTLSAIAFMVAAATIHQLVRIILKRPVDEKKEGIAVRSLHCFSAINNIGKLVNTNKSSDDLSCIHGMRFLSTTWVVTGHVWSSAQFNNLTRFMIFNDAFKISMLTITNATVSVDTFFTMSGMLVSYLLLRELHRNKGKFNVVLFYVHRYLRLTPVYAVILGFLATIMVYCGTGPSWGAARIASHGCRVNWWGNLLYINNIVKVNYDESCMGETWYLANDMQFFLISPLFIYPIWRWRKYGFLVRFSPLIALTLASLAANIAIFAVNDIPMTMFVTRSSNIGDYFDLIYLKPWVRAPPYFVGVFFGWALYETKKTNYKLNKILVYCCWASAAAIALAIVYGIYPYLDQVKVPVIDKATTVIYGSFHRFAWSVVVCWVIYACVFGYGGMINEFLSWSAFTPLSRLSYCVYLIHLNYLTIYQARSRTLQYYTILDEIHYYLGLLVVAYGFAFIASVAVEAPFINLEKLIFTYRKPVVKGNADAKVDAENPKGHVNLSFNKEEQ